MVYEGLACGISSCYKRMVENLAMKILNLGSSGGLYVTTVYQIHRRKGELVVVSLGLVLIGVLLTSAVTITVLM